MTDNKTPVHPGKIKIVQAAVTCFLKRGFHQTGVRDIAKQAGVSLGNLYNHFEGKDAVLAFIAELESDELLRFKTMLSDRSDPAAALVAFVHAFSAYAQNPENALLGLELMAEAIRNPAIAKAFEPNREDLIDALAGCIQCGSEAGVFTPRLDAREYACMILDAIEGHGLRKLLAPQGQKNATKMLVHYTLSSIMPGVAPSAQDSSQS